MVMQPSATTIKIVTYFSLARVSSETHNLQRVFRPGAVVPYVGLVGMCGVKGYGFLAVLV